jgi:hypothetical protein
MRAGEVALMECVVLCRYNAAGARQLLTVERYTLVSGRGMSAALTLGAVALGGGVKLTMAYNFQIAALQLVASMGVVGMVLQNVQRTLHAARTVRSAVEIVDIAQWIGYSHHVSATQQQQGLACKNKDINNAWGQGQHKIHLSCVGLSWRGRQGHCRQGF